MTSKTFEDRYPFDVAGLFAGLKALSLSLEASLFELIDNSVGHGNAEKTDVRLEWYDDSSRLSRVAVVDNGRGMDRVTLFDALITGKSISYNNRDTIGRFGFGLKAGGLNQCRIIEVYSQVKNSDSYYAVLDYDAFLQGKQKMSAPTKKDIPKEFQDIIKKQGTVVIWSNLDIAQPIDQSSGLDELRYQIGNNGDFQDAIFNWLLGGTKKDVVTATYGEIKDWDVSKVTNMRNLILLMLI